MIETKYDPKALQEAIDKCDTNIEVISKCSEGEDEKVKLINSAMGDDGFTDEQMDALGRLKDSVACFEDEIKALNKQKEELLILLEEV